MQRNASIAPGYRDADKETLSAPERILRHLREHCAVSDVQREACLEAGSLRHKAGFAPSLWSLSLFVFEGRNGRSWPKLLFFIWMGEKRGGVGMFCSLVRTGHISERLSRKGGRGDRFDGGCAYDHSALLNHIYLQNGFAVF